MRLAGKIAAVTGGGKGIGAGICKSLASDGARVAVLDIDMESAEQVVSGIGSDNAIAIRCDVTSAAGHKKAVAQIVEKWGSLDIWVNNAGVSFITPFLDCAQALWEKTLQINLTGTFLGCQAALGQMAGQESGAIINMSSQSGRQGNSQYAAYCASKFGIIGLTQSLAVEFAPLGIRVNALCPGVVFTSLWDEQIKTYAAKRDMPVEDVKPYLEAKIPLGRIGTVEDVARAAVFLASEDSSYMTGQAMNVSGGCIM